MAFIFSMMEDELGIEIPQAAREAAEDRISAELVANAVRRLALSICLVHIILVYRIGGIPTTSWPRGFSNVSIPSKVGQFSTIPLLPLTRTTLSTNLSTNQFINNTTYAIVDNSFLFIFFNDENSAEFNVCRRSFVVFIARSTLQQQIVCLCR